MGDPVASGSELKSLEEAEEEEEFFIVGAAGYLLATGCWVQPPAVGHGPWPRGAHGACAVRSGR